MDKHSQERLQRLQKRLDWLTFRIYKEDKAHPLTFDRAEASALEWGIEIIKKYFELSPQKGGKGGI